MIMNTESILKAKSMDNITFLDLHPCRNRNKVFYYSTINVFYDLSNSKLQAINQFKLSPALILVKFPSTKCHTRFLKYSMANITLHNVFKGMVVFKHIHLHHGVIKEMHTRIAQGFISNVLAYSLLFI